MEKYLQLALVALISFAVSPVLAEGDAEELARSAFYDIEEKPYDSYHRQRATENIQRAQELNPDEPWVSIALSRIVLEMAYRVGNRHKSGSYSPERLEVARQYAERSVSLGPQESVAYSQLARIQIISGDARAAWGTLNEAYRHDPNDFLPWYLRSVIAVQMNDPIRAESAFVEAGQRANRLYQSRILLQERANLARLTNDHESRDRLYREIIELDPSNAHAYGNYGSFLLSQQRYAEAITQLEAAIEISPYPLALEHLQRARSRLSD